MIVTLRGCKHTLHIGILGVIELSSSVSLSESDSMMFPGSGSSRVSLTAHKNCNGVIFPDISLSPAKVRTCTLSLPFLHRTRVISIPFCNLCKSVS